MSSTRDKRSTDTNKMFCDVLLKTTTSQPSSIFTKQDDSTLNLYIAHVNSLEQKGQLQFLETLIDYANDRIDSLATTLLYKFVWITQELVAHFKNHWRSFESISKQQYINLLNFVLKERREIIDDIKSHALNCVAKGRIDPVNVLSKQLRRQIIDAATQLPDLLVCYVYAMHELSISNDCFKHKAILLIDKVMRPYNMLLTHDVINTMREVLYLTSMKKLHFPIPSLQRARESKSTMVKLSENNFQPIVYRNKRNLFSPSARCSTQHKEEKVEKITRGHAIQLPLKKSPSLTPDALKQLNRRGDLFPQRGRSYHFFAIQGRDATAVILPSTAEYKNPTLS